MNKKISLGAAIAYMAIVAAVAFSLTMIYSMNLFNVKMTGITEREKMYSSLHEVDLYVRENYYGSMPAGISMAWRTAMPATSPLRNMRPIPNPAAANM